MRSNFYNRRTEPDLRFELDATLRGIFPEIPKAINMLLRKMRRDTDSKLIKCSCVDLVTHEPDIDTFCPICHGEGNLWDETLVEGYKQTIGSTQSLVADERQLKSGIINVQSINFYTRYDTVYTQEDKLVELYLTVDGEIVIPYRRKKIYVINTTLDFRSDYGRLEYWKLSGYEQERKFLNGVKGV